MEPSPAPPKSPRGLSESVATLRSVPAAEVARLRALGRAAVHARGLDAGAGAKLDALLLDLDCQLARGSQAQHDRAVARRCTQEEREGEKVRGGGGCQQERVATG